MDKQSQNRIEVLGFDERFYAGELEKASEFAIARVMSVHKDRFTISGGMNESRLTFVYYGDIHIAHGYTADFKQLRGLSVGQRE